MKFTKNKTEEIKKESNVLQFKINGLKELLKLSSGQKKTMGLVLICVILINLSVLFKPYILKVVIDEFLVKKVPQSWNYSITMFAILYIAVSFAGGILSYIQVNLINRAGQDIVMKLRSRVFYTIQFLPLSLLDKNQSGRMITRATNDVAEISDLYTDVVINLVKDSVLLLGIIYAMFSINVTLAFISLSVLPVIVIIVTIIKNKLKSNFFDMKHFIGKINGFIAENISGMRIIQIFRAEKEKEEEFLKLNDSYFKTTLVQVNLNGIMKPATDIFQNLAIAMAIWYSMGKIEGHSLEIGVLFAFTTYIKQFFNPISDLADKYSNIQSALVSANRVFEFLNQEKLIENIKDGLSLEKTDGVIEFRNVWFSYNDKDWVLKNLSFKINKGEKAAFVGETGAGKSTIINLINRFYKVQKGEILIDGVNIDYIKLEDLRKRVAVVLQDVFLFSGTIRENITLNDFVEEDKLDSAIKLSCSDKFIENLPNGKDEVVLERGINFSSGQRQLLSFARAIVKEPSIFILDEATANIDSSTEKLIQQAVENSSKDRTTIVIAHRLSTIKNSDKIIVMKNGSIAEEGNHDSLVKLGGYYAQLLKKSEFTAG